MVDHKHVDHKQMSSNYNFSNVLVQATEANRWNMLMTNMLNKLR